jgi:hypothetical protein
MAIQLDELSREDQQRWHELNDDFAWAPAALPEAPEKLPLYELPFTAIIVVRSKSDSETGRAAHNHLLGVLRGEDRAIQGRFEVNRDELLDIPSDFHFVLMRTNAEIPANPVHHSFALGVNPQAKLVAGFDYKTEG